MTELIDREGTSSAPELEVWATPPQAANGSRVPAQVSRLPSLQPREPGTGMWVVGVSLTILAVLAATFAVELVGIGHLRHAKAQKTAYANFRTQLAESTAPVGQTDYRGLLLPMGAPVAMLRIPSIGVRELVLEGTTSRVLQSGAGHERDTGMPGQYGASLIYGRGLAYGAPFRRLHELHVGDAMTVTTGQSEKPYQFRVVALRRKGQAYTPVSEDGARITLVTSDGPWYAPSGTLYVDADLVGQPAPRAALQFDNIGARELPMATDTTALTSLLLWVQGLLVAAAAFVWARARWGRVQSWMALVPVLLVVGLSTAHVAARLLPNLL